KASDLPEALRWVTEQGEEPHAIAPTESLADAIMMQAWANLDTPGVLDAFAQAALARLSQHHHSVVRDREKAVSFDNAWQTEDRKRRLVVETMLAHLPDPHNNWDWRYFSRAGGPLGKDMAWLLQRLAAAPSEEKSRDWFALVRQIFQWQDRGHLREIL